MNAAAVEHDQKLSLNDQLRDKYQLKTEPFSDTAHLFFQGAQRQHNLETLRHLVSYGDMVLLLTGGAGSGKSTLLAELAKHIVDGVRVINLKPSLIASPRKLAHELCKRLDMQQVEGEPVTRTMERVLETCAHNATSGERLLLVVDDAHKTNSDSFSVLLSTFRGLGGDSGICLLVSGRPEILQSITCEGVDPSTCSWIHQIHLKPFSQEDAETYVSLRLIRAGSKVEPVFSDAQKKALYELGKGCPGRINRIAPGVLLDSFEVASPRVKSQKGLSGLLLGVVVSLLVSFGVIGYQYNLFFAPSDSAVNQVEGGESFDNELSGANLTAKVSLANRDDATDDEDSALAQSRAELLEKIQQAEKKVSELPDVNVDVVKSGIEEGKPIAVNQPVVNVAGEAVYSSDGVIQPNEVISNDSVDRAVTASVPEKAAEIPKNETLSAEVSPKDEGVLAQKPKADNAESTKNPVIENNVSIRHSRFRDDKWVSTQQKGAFTIQVLGSRNEQTAIKYIEAERSSKELIYIESLYKEKPWFVVVFGVYPNKAAARAKMNNLPLSVKKQEPWIRSLEGL